MVTQQKNASKYRVADEQKNKLHEAVTKMYETGEAGSPNPSCPPDNYYVHPFAKSGYTEREHKHMQTMKELREIKKAYAEPPSAESGAFSKMSHVDLDSLRKEAAYGSSKPIFNSDGRSAIRKQGGESGYDKLYKNRT